MKYEIMMSCGHEDTVELFGKERERDRKIEYLKIHGLCKECYRKKKEEETKKEGLIFNATVLPYINEKDGSILLSVWFSGDTKPHKDEIKSLGNYSWSERESADDWYSFQLPTLCWNKIIKLDSLEEEIIKATSIGAKSMVADSGLFAEVHYRIALERQKEWREKKEKIDLIKKPAVPEVLKGCTWNQKIYGKAGNYSIYPNGDKKLITDEQAEEIKNYLTLKEEYRKKVNEIKNA